MAEIVEGWVDLEQGAALNRAAPDANVASPGRPYFVDLASAVAGQWVRLGFRDDADRRFWAVGLLADFDDQRLRVTQISYESDDPAPDWFADERWTAILERASDGWTLVELEELDDPDDD